MLRYPKKFLVIKHIILQKLKTFRRFFLHTFVLKYNFDDNKPLQYNNQHQLHSN